MLRIVQLSDCHVTRSPDVTYRGENPRATLEALLESVAAWGPDLVLGTGDLSEDASDSSYEFLRQALASLPVSLWVTPGNHDDPVALRAHFEHCVLDGPDLVAESSAGCGWRVLMLNSARPGAIDGHLDKAQLQRLEQLLTADARPTLLALHHQPWPVGSPWIDRYALQAPEALHACLAAGEGVRVVLWGHVHQALRFERGRVTGLSGPSTASNSLPGQQRFTPDPAGPACRWLELHDNGLFSSGLLRASNP